MSMKNVSSRLGFSIAIPSDWIVNEDSVGHEPAPSLEQRYEMFQRMFPDSTFSLEEYKKYEEETHRLYRKRDTAEEAYQKLLNSERAKASKMGKFKKVYEQDRKTAYRMFFDKLLGMPANEKLDKLASRELSAEEAYSGLMADPETFLVDFETFKWQYEAEQEALDEERRRKQGLEEMQQGLFEAAPSVDRDFASVEVVKLKLKRPMTAIELYELDKPRPTVTLWGARPSKTITVDRIPAVGYYFIPDTGDIKFLNVYLTQGITGWIISCSCKVNAFPKYKGVFNEIIHSFRRI